MGTFQISMSSARKNYEDISKLHSLLFGYEKDDGEIVEGRKQKLENVYAELEQKNAAIIAKAKESVINAEIKALQGYDNKLLARLIDSSKLTVDDSGKVTGLDEAVKAVEAEFPGVRIKEEKPHKPFIPFNPAGDETESVNKTMNDLIRGKR